MIVSRLQTTAADAAASPAPAVRARGPRRWLAGGAVAVAAVALFAAYLRQSQTLPVESDGASQALQAWSLLHGNLLLRGWLLTDVSFYTTEIPQYALVELVHGLNSDVVHIASAMTYTLIVLLGAFLARGRATGGEGALRALIAAGIMLAPSPGLATYALIANPDHTGTQVPLLLTWLVIDRARPGWRGAAAAGILLAWAMVADPLVLYEGVLPLLLVCAARLYRDRKSLRRRRGQEQWYEAYLAAAGIAAAVAADAAVAAIRALGGYVVTTPSATFALVRDLSSNVWVTVESVLELYGADFSGKTIGLGAAIVLIHLAGLGLAVWAFAITLRHFYRSELMVQVIAVAAIVLLLAYVLRGSPIIAGSPHEIAGVLPIGAVLAGRVLPGRLRAADLVIPLAVVLACYCGILARDAARPPAPSSRTQIAAWLEGHHLSYGLSDYWTANAVTLYSGNRVQVRPPERPGSDTSWFSPAAHDARFYLIPACPSLSGRTRQAWLSQVLGTFGKPARTYTVAGYLVLVWHSNLLASPRIPVPPPATSACAEGTP
jgi:hypothetical protein